MTTLESFSVWRKSLSIQTPIVAMYAQENRTKTCKGWRILYTYIYTYIMYVAPVDVISWMFPSISLLIDGLRCKYIIVQTIEQFEKKKRTKKKKCFRRISSIVLGLSRLKIKLIYIYIYEDVLNAKKYLEFWLFGI